ncbi:hypothetical protein [Gordonia sihwensis]|uniref:hypothetical protein n=1 Tax=Gordonia sihwensis TaxID=173559 RepID=UPI003D9691EB
MAEIRKYILVNINDEEVGDYYDTLEEAKRAAGRDYAVAAHVYEYSDSELLWTPNGDDRWPPEG